MPSLTNRQILLCLRPTGLGRPDDTELVSTTAPGPADGEELVRTTYIGIDAAARTWLDGQPWYLPALQPGDVIRLAGIGDVVTTLTGFQKYVLIRADIFTTPIRGYFDNVGGPILDEWGRFDEAFAARRRWKADGKPMHRQTIFDGIESCVDALNGLFTGANIGKTLVKLSEPTVA